MCAGQLTVQLCAHLDLFLIISQQFNIISHPGLILSSLAADCYLGLMRSAVWWRHNIDGVLVRSHRLIL